MTDPRTNPESHERSRTCRHCSGHIWRSDQRCSNGAYCTPLDWAGLFENPAHPEPATPSVKDGAPSAVDIIRRIRHELDHTMRNDRATIAAIMTVLDSTPIGTIGWVEPMGQPTDSQNSVTEAIEHIKRFCAEKRAQGYTVSGDDNLDALLQTKAINK